MDFEKRSEIKQKNQRFVCGRNGRGERRGGGREDKAREHNRSKVNTGCTHTSPSSQSLLLPVGGVCVREGVCCWKYKIVRNGTDSF